MDCWKGYPLLGRSIYSPLCDNSSSQVLFGKQRAGYFWLDQATRRDKGPECCPNRSKGHRKLKQNLSHYEIIQMRKAQSFYDPKSYRQL